MDIGTRCPRIGRQLIWSMQHRGKLDRAPNSEERVKSLSIAGGSPVDENSLEVLTSVHAIRMASELCQRVKRDLLHQKLAQKLNISKPSLKMDSQAKYGILARGEVSLYLRVPSFSKSGYKEKVCDHAAGSVIAEEAGGRVTDVLGNPLDFSSGIRMERNHGILASNGILHEMVIKALSSMIHPY